MSTDTETEKLINQVKDNITHIEDLLKRVNVLEKQYSHETNIEISVCTPDTKYLEKKNRPKCFNGIFKMNSQVWDHCKHCSHKKECKAEIH